MILNGKEILMLSALLASCLTKDLSHEEMLSLKLLISQLNCDICTLFSAKTLEKDVRPPKNK